MRKCVSTYVDCEKADFKRRSRKLSGTIRIRRVVIMGADSWIDTIIKRPIRRAFISEGGPETRYFIFFLNISASLF